MDRRARAAVRGRLTEEHTAMTTSRPNRVQYLYADLETTGLDTACDEIIEVAVIGANADLEPLFEATFLTMPTVAGMNRMLADRWIRVTNTANGIFAELDAASQRAAVTGVSGLLSVSQIQDELLRLLGEHDAQPGNVSLAGSGVAEFDKVFLERLMPTLMGVLHYRTTDVGYLRRSYLFATGHVLTEVNDTKTHRALDDVRAHITEERTFRNFFRAHDAAAVA